MKRSLIVGFVATAALALVPASAMAALENICVPTGPNEPVISTKTSGTSCKTSYTLVAPTPMVLKEIAPYITFNKEGVDGKPTIRFSGVNVQVVNGEGKTETINGEGNLVIGYDEEPGVQTGSHDIILGNRQAYTSYGSLLGGSRNTAFAPFTTVFGVENQVLEMWASILGGVGGKATGILSSISSGDGNIASGAGASVSGGVANVASSEYAWVGGGEHNKSQAPEAAISGGNGNAVGAEAASISGGQENVALGRYGSILGGKGHTITEEWGTFPE
jgi:hypothetical protein